MNICSSESRVQFKDEHDDHVDESLPLEALPANQSREKRRSTGVRMKGNLVSSCEVASSKTFKARKGSVIYASSPEEIQDAHHSTPKTRKKQKIQVSKVRMAHSFSFIVANLIFGIVGLH